VRPHILSVDFSGTREALQTNIRSRAEARKLLERGGVLIVFPSGGVAKARTFRGPAEDLEWKWPRSQAHPAQRCWTL
jgi:putative hemolysin